MAKWYLLVTVFFLTFSFFASRQGFQIETRTQLSHEQEQERMYVFLEEKMKGGERKEGEEGGEGKDIENRIKKSQGRKEKPRQKPVYEHGEKKDDWYHPKPGTSWQWQLSGKLNTSYDVDLYDIDLFETSKEVIEKLHRDGRKVICYFNAGAYEPYRPDAGRFPKLALGKKMEGWEEERWLDIAHYESFADIMRARLDLAKEKGCDGVEPDNIDGYTNETGFSLTPEDQTRYNRWLAREAHKRGLAIALKNDLDQVLQLVDDFDFALNEQCFEYDECEKLLPFIRKGKAVLGVEYELNLENFCPQAEKYHFSWLKMDWSLNGERTECR